MSEVAQPWIEGPAGTRHYYASPVDELPIETIPHVGPHPPAQSVEETRERWAQEDAAGALTDVAEATVAATLNALPPTAGQVLVGTEDGSMAWESLATPPKAAVVPPAKDEQVAERLQAAQAALDAADALAKAWGALYERLPLYARPHDEHRAYLEARLAYEKASRR